MNHLFTYILWSVEDGKTGACTEIVVIFASSIMNASSSSMKVLLKNFTLVLCLPGSAYDSSCDGTWVLMKDAYVSIKWDSSSNNIVNSDAMEYLNGAFLDFIDSDIQNAIKRVKIPYTTYIDYQYKVVSGSNGMSCKVFPLSGTEVGFSGVSGVNTEGVKLSYFNSASKRIAYNSNSACTWWLRSMVKSNSYVMSVNPDGSYYTNWLYYSDCYIRPAFVLPSSLVVSDDGTVSTNTAPAINASSTNLGEKNAPFNFGYTVTDADGDTLTVTEKLDGKTTKTRTGVASGTVLTFRQASTADGFQRILNGSHTIKITASDGKDSRSLNATFTKSVTAATVTLTTPLAVDGDITVAVLQVTGSIPDDAAFKVEATNNANDPSPVWQDATEEVQKGANIVFSNKTATNGAAFNFRISVARGASGTGGYIEAISGAFQ